MYLSDIKRDDRFEGYLIVRSAEQRASANGKNYLDMTLADKSGSINAKMWDGTVQPPLAGSIVKVRATGNEFNGRMQLRVEKIRAAESRDQVDMSALIPCAPRDPNEMLGEVVRAADHIADPDLRRITCELLDRAGDKLLTFPAAKQMHHAERSGLLHHTTTMLRAANAIMSVYPQLNASLLIAGVIVHDLAKIDEMDADTLGLVSDYSVDGKLIGHIELLEDPRYKTNDLRCKNYIPDLQDLIRGWVRQYTKKELEAMMDEVAIPCGPVLNMKEAIEHPHIKAREMLVHTPTPHPLLGDMPVQGVVAKLSKTPGGVYTPAPTLGQHNREVFGLTPEQEAALRAEGVI